METNEKSESTEDQATGKNASDVEIQPRFHSVKRLVQILAWPIYYTTPRLLVWLYEDRTTNSEFAIEQDRKENLESQLAKGEKVERNCIWVCEIFGPLEIQNLYASLERLGWDEDPFPEIPKHSERIKLSRNNIGVAHIDLGLIFSKDDKKITIGRTLKAEFPSEFEKLHAWIYQPTPSLTCLVVRFDLKEKEREAYEKILNSYLTTKYIPYKRPLCYYVPRPINQKNEQILANREKFSEIAANWLNENFQGFFAKYTDFKTQRSAELIVLKYDDQIKGAEKIDATAYRWQHILGVGDESGAAWSSVRIPALRFRDLNEFNFASKFNFLSFSINWNKVKKEDLEYFGKEGAHQRAIFVSEKMVGILPIYAVMDYTMEVLAQCRNIRQTIDQDQGENTERKLDRISEFFRNFVGVQTIAKEISELPKSSYFSNYFNEFEEQDPFDRNKTYLLSDGFKRQLEHLGSLLRSEEKDTRDFLDQYSNVIEAKESIRAQKLSLAIGIIAIIIALISLFVVLVK